MAIVAYHFSIRLKYLLHHLRSSRLDVRGWAGAHLGYRRHGKPRGQDGSCLVELHLVLIREVLLLEHRSTVLSDEGVHLDMREEESMWEVKNRKGGDGGDVGRDEAVDGAQGSLVFASGVSSLRLVT